MSDASGKVRRAQLIVLTALSWLATAVLGLAAIYYFHALAILLYDALGGKEFRVGELIGQGAVFFGALAWLAAIIGSGEYHLKHTGERKAWQISAWIFVIELVIVITGIVATKAS